MYTINNLAASDAIMVVACGIVGMIMMLITLNKKRAHDPSVFGLVQNTWCRFAVFFGGLAVAIALIVMPISLKKVSYVDLFIAAGEWTFGPAWGIPIGLIAFVVLCLPIYTVITLVYIAYPKKTHPGPSKA